MFFYTVDYRPNATNKPATRFEQLLELREVQEWIIKPMLRTVPGVAEVNTSGGYEKQIVVLPDPEKMMSAGLTYTISCPRMRRTSFSARDGRSEPMRSTVESNFRLTSDESAEITAT